VAKALFLGGVTRRFPDLNFAFLEGGVGWGCQLFCDLIEHWERRGAKGLANMDPTKLDRKLLRELVDKYGYADIGAELDRRDGWPMKEEDSLTGGVPLDDYHFCKISQKQDWIDLFATPYYFGCEADDRMNAVAFGKMMPLGARINALFSSDIGHFDVVDMRDPLPEAYELVEDGHITRAISPTSSSAMRCACGGRRIRGSSRARGSRGRLRNCSRSRRRRAPPRSQAVRDAEPVIPAKAGIHLLRWPNGFPPPRE
jgi:hypothetical protein